MSDTFRHTLYQSRHDYWKSFLRHNVNENKQISVDQHAIMDTVHSTQYTVTGVARIFCGGGGQSRKPVTEASRELRQGYSITDWGPIFPYSFGSWHSTFNSDSYYP